MGLLYSLGILPIHSSLQYTYTNACRNVLPLRHIHRESKNDTKLLSISSPNIDRFSKFFTDTLGREFAVKQSLKIKIFNSLCFGIYWTSTMPS